MRGFLALIRHLLPPVTLTILAPIELLGVLFILRVLGILKFVGPGRYPRAPPRYAIQSAISLYFAGPSWWLHFPRVRVRVDLLARDRVRGGLSFDSYAFLGYALPRRLRGCLSIRDSVEM